MAEIDTSTGTEPDSSSTRRDQFAVESNHAWPSAAEVARDSDPPVARASGPVRPVEQRTDEHPDAGPVAESDLSGHDTLEVTTIDAGASTPPKPVRRGRVRKWDRPPAPHDWRWYIGTLGKMLISVGLLMFGFVAYQLWGTAIETAAAQNDLENQFEQQLASVGSSDPMVPTSTIPTSTVPTPTVPTPTVPTQVDAATPDPGVEEDPALPEPTTDTGPAAVPVEQQNLPALADGDALARLEIPRIGVDSIVVAGVETGDLKKGPGHFPDTPLPGQLGNSAIAGHRTTYGQPFFNVGELQVGDPIRVTTMNGVFTYRVTGQAIVSPSDYGVVATSDPTRANLTLTSCHPKYTARERIVIFSELDTTESAQVGAPVLNYGRPTRAEPTTEIPGDVEIPGNAETPGDAEIPGDVELPADAEIPGDAELPADPDRSADPEAEGTAEITDSTVVADTSDNAIDELGTADVNDGIADAFSDGWFSDPSANPQVGLWGLAVAAIGLGAFLLSRRLRRDWAGLLMGILPFVVALYFFFQNVNRLLPPNL